MRNESLPHYFNVFPTGSIPVPVCIGDLPMSEYTVSEFVRTEEVASYMTSAPMVPGAIIVRNQKAIGIIPRHKMFERLGRRYGVELFLRRPIIDMARELQAELFILKSHLSVNLAVKLALSRDQDHIYDPVVVEFEFGNVQLLDMYVLLLSQSQLSNNLSGVVSSLNNIEMMLANVNANPINSLDLIMESLGNVVPFHHACILMRSRNESEMITHKFISYHSDPLERNSIYKSVLSMNQPMVLEDVRMVPAWSNWDTPQDTRSWLGVPITENARPVGLLSLSRSTFSPFTNHEKEIALVFARYVDKLLSNFADQLIRRRQFEKKYLHQS